MCLLIPILPEGEVLPDWIKHLERPQFPMGTMLGETYLSNGKDAKNGRYAILWYSRGDSTYSAWKGFCLHTPILPEGSVCAILAGPSALGSRPSGLGPIEPQAAEGGWRRRWT